MSLESLCDSLTVAGVPFATVRVGNGRATVVYTAEATGEHRATGDAMASAWREPTATEASRHAAKRLADSGEPNQILLRAVLRLLLAAHSEERAYLALVRSQVQALGGTLPPAPVARDWPQLLAAMTQMIDAGHGDAAPRVTRPADTL